jgi:hypothetical protein
MCFSIGGNDPRVTKDTISDMLKKNKNDFQDSKITTFVLSLIALFIGGSGFFLIGFGTLPATMPIGLGFFPYIAGVQLCILSGFTFVSSLVFLAITSYRHYQKIQLEKKRTEL